MRDEDGIEFGCPPGKGYNYKALKAASKISVRKQKVVDMPANKDKGIEENSHEELQVVCKKYDPDTGEAQGDIVRTLFIPEIKNEIEHCKSGIAKLQAEQADLEELEKDLKAL